MGEGVFVKTRPGAPAAYFQREADGLRWLTAAGGAPTVEVLHVAADRLELVRIPSGTPTAESAHIFGRELARTHAAGALAYGCAPPSTLTGDGYIADAPLPFGEWASFGVFYADARVTPYLDVVPSLKSRPVFKELLSRLHAEDPTVIGPPEPPSRIHGDLWSGNVMWSADDGRAWLIDPAAHGGHRETDLAMLALFGAPHLAEILRGYQEDRALSPGWQSRIALHQVHPLLVHAALFGGHYAAQAEAAARTALRSS
jgi:fructosamine-3-kinase